MDWSELRSRSEGLGSGASSQEQLEDVVEEALSHDELERMTNDECQYRTTPVSDGIQPLKTELYLEALPFPLLQ